MITIIKTIAQSNIRENNSSSKLRSVRLTLFHYNGFLFFRIIIIPTLVERGIEHIIGNMSFQQDQPISCLRQYKHT